MQINKLAVLNIGLTLALVALPYIKSTFSRMRLLGPAGLVRPMKRTLSRKAIDDTSTSKIAL